MIFQFIMGLLVKHVQLYLYLFPALIPTQVFARDSCKDQVRELNGEEFRISLFDMPPLLVTSKASNGNVTYSGMAADLLNIFLQYTNVRAVFVPIDRAKVDKWGLLQALLQEFDGNNIDIVPFWFEITLEMLNYMELSPALWTETYTLLQPWPEEESRLLAPIRPFDPEVWLFLLVSVVSLAAILSGLIVIFVAYTKVELHNRPLDPRRPMSYYETVVFHFEFLLRSITSQGLTIAYWIPTSIRLAIAAWLLSIVVIIYAYTGLLIATLSVPKLMPTINSLEEAVNRTCVTSTRGFHFSKQILAATSGTYKIIGDHFRHTPSLLAKTDLEAWENVVKRRCVFTTGISYGEFVVRGDSKMNNGKCRLTTSRNVLPFTISIQVGIRIGSRLATIGENCFWLRIWENGALSYFKSKYLPHTQTCRVDARPEGKIKPLSLVELTAAFAVLVAGLILSIFICLLENCIACMQQK